MTAPKPAPTMDFPPPESAINASSAASRLEMASAILNAKDDEGNPIDLMLTPAQYLSICEAGRLR